MATDLEIKVKVDSSQLDQTQQKVGQLQQLSKNIAIQYDIDGKPLDVVIDKSLNLKRQVVELTKALRTVKEGSDEFRVLSSALGNANDNLSASNAKSRDLLGSLQLIPGPIGQIASQLNGAISALKLFSGFSLKDLKFQFKELTDDIADISKNLFGLGAGSNSIDEITDAAAKNTAAIAENNNVLQEGLVNYASTLAANQGNKQAIDAVAKSTSDLTKSIGGNMQIRQNSIKLSREEIETLNARIIYEKEQTYIDQTKIQNLNALLVRRVKSGQISKAEYEALNALNREKKLELALNEKITLDLADQEAARLYRMNKLVEMGQVSDKVYKREYDYLNALDGADKKRTASTKKAIEATIMLTAATGSETEVLKVNEFIKKLQTKGIDVSTTVMEINTLANEQNTLATEGNTAATTTNTVTTETNAVANETDAAAKVTNTAATNTLTTSTSTLSAAMTALGTILSSAFVFFTSLATLIGVLGYKFYQYVTATTAAEEAQKSINEALGKGTEELGKAQSAVNEVGIAFELAAKGTITKKDALDVYNKILGSTIGEAKTYQQAEDLYNANTGNYIRATGLRAQAQALFAVAAQKSAEAITAEERGFFSFERGLFQNKTSELIERKNKLNATANLIREEGNKLLADAMELESTFTPETKTTETKKPDPVKAKELQDKELIEKEKQLSAALIKEQKDREIYQLEIAKNKEQQQIKDLNISEKNEGVRAAALLTLENKFQIEKQAIITKYAEEDKKKQEEIANKKKDAANNLLETSIKSIKDEVVRSRVERIKQFNQEKEKLDQFLKDGLITREKYNEAILNMQKAFANDIEKINTDARIKELEAQKGIDESRLRMFQMNMEQSNSARLWFINDFIAQQLKVEEDNYQIERERHKNNAKELLRIDAEHATNVAAIKEGERQQKLQIYNQGLDDLAGIFAAESDLQKGAIILKQTLLAIELGMEIKKAIASAKLTAAKAKLDLAAGTAATAKIGFPQNIIPIALYAIQAAAIISTIVTAIKGIGPSGAGSAEAVPTAGKNYGKGGIIEGPSHSSAAGGTIINAEGGEAVMTKGAVTMFRPLLSMLNQAGGGTAFGGGVVGQGPYDNPDTADKSMEPQIIKTYIVERDLTSIQERQARLKSLSTL
jgi:hypothetical protein